MGEAKLPRRVSNGSREGNPPTPGIARRRKAARADRERVDSARPPWQNHLVSFDLVYTLIVLALSIVLFASDRFRLDVVALLALLALVLGGIVPFEEAVAGFSSPLVLMIVGLFVVGAGLTETGVADWLGNQLGRMSKGGEVRLLVLVMLTTALFSAFMSSTGTVAILLPVVGTLAQRRGVPLSRAFLPLAFAAHLGSLLTLIATPPNLVVSEALADAGRTPFRFFSFAPVGLVVLLVGVAYMVVAGRKLLPQGTEAPSPREPLSPHDFAEDYGLAPNLHTLRVPPHSPLVGKTLAEADIRADSGVNVLSVGVPTPAGLRARPVLPRLPFSPREILLVHGAPEAIAVFTEKWGLEPSPQRAELTLGPEETLVEVVVTRRSGLEGRTLREARFRERYRATVIGIRRGARGKPVQELQDAKLEVGDMLLLKGRRRYLRNLQDERRDFLVVAAPDPPTHLGIRRWPAIQALAITLAMLLTMAFGWLPNALAVMCAGFALVLFNAVRPADAYRAVNWESVVVIAGMLPMATALDRTGATGALVRFVETHFAGASPHLLLAAVTVLTTVLGLVISNTATAVLVAPVAVRIAEAMGVAPEPLLMGVAVGASAAFSTPVSSPVNTLVVSPGGYRFADFLRVGVPLHVLVIVAAVLVVPLVFPF